MNQMNKQLVLISGESTTGKSASLIDLPNPEGVLYLNCEAGKHLPFRSRFNEITITDPFHVLDAFDMAKSESACTTVVIDTLTFLMDMFESIYVINSANTMQAWGQYQQFFKTLMQEKIASLGKPVIILAHTRSDFEDQGGGVGEMRTAVPIKGALKNNGVEAYFSTVVSTKKVSLKKLEPYKDNGLLHITEDDEDLGYKHVFQTRLTKETTGERIRSPMGLYSKKQTFIDASAGQLLRHLDDFYA